MPPRSTRYLLIFFYKTPSEQGILPDRIFADLIIERLWIERLLLLKYGVERAWSVGLSRWDLGVRGLRFQISANQVHV